LFDCVFPGLAFKPSAMRSVAGIDRVIVAPELARLRMPNLNAAPSP